MDLRALELEREIYAADSPVAHNRAVMAKCEVRKQQSLYREALAELSRVYTYAFDEAEMLNFYTQKALVAYLSGEYELSLGVVDEMRVSLPGLTPPTIMTLVEALAAGEVGDWERSERAAKHYASSLPNGAEVTSELEALYDDTPSLRNPKVAYWLSLIPGVGQLYAGEVWSGVVSLAVNGALATFGVSEMIAGEWLSGWIVGCGGLSTTYFVGQERARILTERRNHREMRKYNDLLRATLLQ